jgi:hypothetical protein
LFGYHCIAEQTARYQPRISRAASTRLCARRRNSVGATQARLESQDCGEHEQRRNQNPESKRRTDKSKNLWLLGNTIRSGAGARNAHRVEISNSSSGRVCR